jgi:lysophospholipase L1-like esterase
MPSEGSFMTPRRNRIVLRLANAMAVVLPLFAGANFASAQTPAPDGSKPVDRQCPRTDTPDPVIVAQLRELSLQPGVKIDPATLMKDPRIAELIAQMTTQGQARMQLDWGGLCRYRVENATQRAKASPRVVFLGDSITENWRYADPSLFSDEIIDRGISGQTSSQILLRFYPDVVALRPELVHIMAGTNDVLKDTDAIGDDDIVNNIAAMIDIAQINHIKVVLASIPPISVQSWQPDLKPAARLSALNERLRVLATARKILFVDYRASLKDVDDGLSADLGNDGVHPNRAGYAAMRPLAKRAIAQALRLRDPATK